MKSQHIHFIGIAGSAIAPVAILMKSLGHKVTGSDEAVYEPARTLLSEAGVEWSEGYDAERIKPADLVILGGAPLMVDINNPEFLAAKELGKQLEGYAYLLKQYVVKDESIVVTGTYGKTTTSALVNWILDVAGENPSFMIGGKPQNFENGVRMTDSKYSCLEGDEYLAVFHFDEEPRFLRYAPKYAILSAAKWDHINVYPTEDSYVDAFKKLPAEVNKNGGKMYVCASGENNAKAVAEYDGELILYMLEGRDSSQFEGRDVNYLAKEIRTEGGKTLFTVELNGGIIGDFETELIGDFNVENCLAAITITHDLGIDIAKIKEAISTFKGIMRRLELKGYTSRGSSVIDDFAHSAVKAKATLDTLRVTYPDRKLICIYYPRPSEREDKNVLSWYEGAFDSADLMILPRIFVKKSTEKEQRIYGKDYIEVISKTQPNAHYVPRNEDIVKLIKENEEDESIIVFMSAGGWGDLMESLIDKKA
ncbi:MAG: Mur ligase family protein [Candidatus Dojkabacteria bacterium]|nr:MAG: Mur ligase family protein [Candidatus Dojkabacteria bacterium]